MPVYKVPVLHKFGIISHSQRVELQKRLLRQTNKANLQSPGLSQRPNASPFKVSEEFVQKYNLASLDEKEGFQDQADKLLERSKRRCGFLTFGEGDHVDLPLAWSELTVLAQCKGKLQEDCFDLLCISLNEAPLSEDNIPTLFFLAESVLYWLRTDAMKQPYLKTSEVKLLKMGYLVFARLFFHHLSGQLRGLADFKTRLHSYLDGIKNQQVLYQSYPGVLLYLRFIDQVGEIVIGPYASSGPPNTPSKHREESVPGLAACVYRALCVWRAAVITKVGLKKAIASLLMAVYELSSKDWISGFLALSLLGEAAKVDMKACRTLQTIARGIQPSVDVDRSFQSEYDPHHQLDLQLVTRRSERLEIMENNFREKLDDLTTSFEDTIETNIHQNLVVNLEKPRPSAGISNEEMKNDSPLQEESQKARNSTVAFVSGLGGWCWENAFHYTQILSEICLHGWSSGVQKSALMGKWQDADVTTFRAGVPNPCIESCGLADLLEYSGPPKGALTRAQSKRHEWAWMVRYGSLYGLCSLTHFLAEDSERMGMRSAAWSLITAIQECPVAEERVLEAIRVSQVAFTNTTKRISSTSIWTRIAERLNDIYLAPPSPSPYPLTSPTPSQRTPEKPRPTPNPKKFTEVAKRPTMREDLLSNTPIEKKIPDFNTRTSLDLKRVVADQWEKELIIKQAEEQKAFLKELEQKQKEDEEREEEKIRRRREKLKGKPTAMLGPYELNFSTADSQ